MQSRHQKQITGIIESLLSTVFLLAYITYINAMSLIINQSICNILYETSLYTNYRWNYSFQREILWRLLEGGLSKVIFILSK